MKIGVFLFSALTILAANEAVADLEEDRKLLSQLAQSYRRNLANIETWQGTAQLTKRYRVTGQNETKDWLTEWAVQFACTPNEDRKGNYRYDLEITKSVALTDGKEMPRMRLERRAGIHKDALYYELSYPTDKDNAARRAHITKKKPMRVGFHYGTFEPLFYFSQLGSWPDEYLEWISNNLEDGKLVGRVTRKDNLVTFTEKLGGISITRTMDLNSGGNCIEYSVSENDGDRQKNSTTERSWSYKNGCWVPEHLEYHDVTFENDHTTKDNLVTVDWTNAILNEPLSEDEFELAKLGLRRGDRVIDNTTGEKYLVGGNSFPSAPAPQNVKPRTSLR